MTITYTSLVPVEPAYDFERGSGDILTGVIREHLTASYRNVNVALLEGGMSIKIADSSSTFTVNVILNNSALGQDTNTTADAKYTELLGLQGSIGTLVKDGITVTNCQLKKITKVSRRWGMQPFPIFASTNYTVLATILFEKLDA